MLLRSICCVDGMFARLISGRYYEDNQRGSAYGRQQVYRDQSIALYKELKGVGQLGISTRVDTTIHRARARQQGTLLFGEGLDV